jgi:hypothetical protein
MSKKSIFSDAPPSDECGGCGLKHKGVEASGIWACSNPLCRATGASWFRSKLKSFKEHSGSHSVDIVEWVVMGLKHALDCKDPVILKAAVNSASERIDEILEGHKPDPEEVKTKEFHRELDSLLKKYEKGK